MADKEAIERLKERTKTYAIGVVRYVSSLPGRADAQVLGKQLLRSGTSVGAQYREACRAKSNADFISKIEGCLQELEESYYWFEILIGSSISTLAASDALMRETKELIAIFTTVVTKVKSRQ